MHEPMKVKDLINLLKNVNEDKEVVVLLAHNYYDITATTQEKNSITLYPKLCYNRESED